MANFCKIFSTMVKKMFRGPPLQAQSAAAVAKLTPENIHRASLEKSNKIINKIEPPRHEDLRPSRRGATSRQGRWPCAGLRPAWRIKGSERYHDVSQCGKQEFQCAHSWFWAPPPPAHSATSPRAGEEFQGDHSCFRAPPPPAHSATSPRAGEELFSLLCEKSGCDGP